MSSLADTRDSNSLTSSPTKVGSTQWGGWLSGAQAQEESITRRSTLFSSLTSEPAQPYYKLNLENMKPHRNDGHYTDALVLSKEIAILQRNETNIFEYDPAPKTCAFITSPAPNARQALKCNVTLTKIQEVFKTRFDRVLAVAVAGGYEGLVLGAWGCGVFGNDPQFVAFTMMKLLTTKYKNKFKIVSFPLRRDGNKDAFEKAVLRGSKQGRKCG
ncbi:hypothetical protein TrCOL_g1573 [Triparma columacea]|uniref:Microbial-type PARG catalytic domain-containing protein n=1 Tax=Triparma columacea TaxID=722753 RepID=A0A9W7FYM0_9STRA|nr:hypothetical protein TrCOL_g1573 [Triparma columacea]